MLIETGLHLSNTRLEQQAVLVLVGQLVLLEREDVQKYTDELTDRWRRCRPVLNADAIGWCQVVHAASMS